MSQTFPAPPATRGGPTSQPGAGTGVGGKRPPAADPFGSHLDRELAPPAAPVRRAGASDARERAAAVRATEPATKRGAEAAPATPATPNAIVPAPAATPPVIAPFVPVELQAPAVAATPQQPPAPADGSVAIAPPPAPAPADGSVAIVPPPAPASADGSVAIVPPPAPASADGSMAIVPPPAPAPVPTAIATAPAATPVASAAPAAGAPAAAAPALPSAPAGAPAAPGTDPATAAAAAAASSGAAIPAPAPATTSATPATTEPATAPVAQQAAAPAPLPATSSQPAAPATTAPGPTPATPDGQGQEHASEHEHTRLPAAAAPAPAAPAPTAPDPAAAQPAAAAAPAPAPQAPVAATPTPFAAATQQVPVTPAPPAAPIAMPAVQHAGVRLAEAAETVRLTIGTASAAGVSHARIALRPAELGGIEIMLIHGPAGISATVTADSPAAAHLLQRAADDLHRSLADQGLNLVRLDIDVAGDRANASARDQQDRGAPSGNGRASADGDAADDQTPIAETTIELPNGVLVDVLA